MAWISSRIRPIARAGPVLAACTLWGCAGDSVSTRSTPPDTTVTTADGNTGTAGTTGGIGCPPITEPAVDTSGLKSGRSPFNIALTAGDLRVRVQDVQRMKTIKVVSQDKPDGFTSPGGFLVIRYRVTNRGTKTIRPARTVNLRLPVAGANGTGFWSVQLAEKPCSDAQSDYAADVNLTSPKNGVAPDESITTVAVYALPGNAPPGVNWVNLEDDTLIPLRTRSP